MSKRYVFTDACGVTITAPTIQSITSTIMAISIGQAAFSGSPVAPVIQDTKDILALSADEMENALSGIVHIQEI